MKGATPDKKYWKGRAVKTVAVDPAEHAKRMHDGVARRAFQICEMRGFAPGHEMEDWRRAECETLRPLGCGLLTLEDKVSVDTDAAVFAEGLIEICVEPRRLTICGEVCACKERAISEPNTAPGNLIFRILDLPVAVDPSQARAGFNGRILQIHLPRVPAATKFHTMPHAA